MNTQEILKCVEHRESKLPTNPWIFYQEWNRAVFLHWKVDVYELRKFVPEELEIDLFDGEAWVSLVAFNMENVHPRYVPAFKPISNFEEINIRTYVKFGGKAGVYFLSIEAGNSVSSWIAKTFSGLPYRYSKMNRAGGNYSSANAQNNDRLELQYEVGPRLENKTELDKFLTERYALFQDDKKGIFEFEIHHIEWPLFSINLKELQLRYAGFERLINKTSGHVHYSTGVQVLTWGKKR